MNGLSSIGSLGLATLLSLSAATVTLMGGVPQFAGGGQGQAFGGGGGQGFGGGGGQAFGGGGGMGVPQAPFKGVIGDWITVGPGKYRITGVTTGVKEYKQRFNQLGKTLHPGFPADRLVVVDVEFENRSGAPIAPPIFTPAITDSEGIHGVDWLMDARQQSFPTDLAKDPRAETSKPSEINPDQTAKLALVFSLSASAKPQQLEFRPVLPPQPGFGGGIGGGFGGGGGLGNPQPGGGFGGGANGGVGGQPAGGGFGGGGFGGGGGGQGGGIAPAQGGRGGRPARRAPGGLMIIIDLTTHAKGA